MVTSMCFIICCLFCTSNVAGQKTDPYSIFRIALGELILEHGQRLPQLEENLKLTSKALEPFALKEPAGLLIWGNEEERNRLNKQLEAIAKEKNEEVPTIPEPTEEFILVTEEIAGNEKATTPKAHIEFTSAPMFPDEPHGYRLFPNYNSPEKPSKLLWKSASLWRDTSLLSIAFEPDPALRKKRKAIADYQAALQQFNMVGLYSSFYECSQSWSEFNDMIGFMEFNGFHLSTFYFGFENYKQPDLVREMKSAIFRLGQNITSGL